MEDTLAAAAAAPAPHTCEGGPLAEESHWRRSHTIVSNEGEALDRRSSAFPQRPDGDRALYEQRLSVSESEKRGARESSTDGSPPPLPLPPLPSSSKQPEQVRVPSLSAPPPLPQEPLCTSRLGSSADISAPGTPSDGSRPREPPSQRVQGEEFHTVHESGTEDVSYNSFTEEYRGANSSSGDNRGHSHSSNGLRDGAVEADAAHCSQLEQRQAQRMEEVEEAGRAPVVQPDTMEGGCPLSPAYAEMLLRYYADRGGIRLAALSSAAYDIGLSIPKDFTVQPFFEPTHASATAVHWNRTAAASEGAFPSCAGDNERVTSEALEDGGGAGPSAPVGRSSRGGSDAGATWEAREVVDVDPEAVLSPSRWLALVAALVAVNSERGKQLRLQRRAEGIGERKPSDPTPPPPPTGPSEKQEGEEGEEEGRHAKPLSSSFTAKEHEAADAAAPEAEERLYNPMNDESLLSTVSAFHLQQQQQQQPAESAAPPPAHLSTARQLFSSAAVDPSLGATVNNTASKAKQPPTPPQQVLPQGLSHAPEEGAACHDNGVPSLPSRYAKEAEEELRQLHDLLTVREVPLLQLFIRCGAQPVKSLCSPSVSSAPHSSEAAKTDLVLTPSGWLRAIALRKASQRRSANALPPQPILEDVLHTFAALEHRHHGGVNSSGSNGGDGDDPSSFTLSFRAFRQELIRQLRESLSDAVHHARLRQQYGPSLTSTSAEGDSAFGEDNGRPRKKRITFFFELPPPPPSSSAPSSAAARIPPRSRARPPTLAMFLAAIDMESFQTIGGVTATQYLRSVGLMLATVLFLVKELRGKVQHCGHQWEGEEDDSPPLRPRLPDGGVSPPAPSSSSHPRQGWSPRRRPTSSPRAVHFGVDATNTPPAKPTSKYGGGGKEGLAWAMRQRRQMSPHGSAEPSVGGRHRHRHRHRRGGADVAQVGRGLLSAGRENGEAARPHYMRPTEVSDNEISASVIARAKARRLMERLRRGAIPIQRYESYVRAEAAEAPVLLDFLAGIQRGRDHHHHHHHHRGGGGDDDESSDSGQSSDRSGSGSSSGSSSSSHHTSQSSDALPNMRELLVATNVRLAGGTPIVGGGASHTQRTSPFGVPGLAASGGAFTSSLKLGGRWGAKAHQETFDRLSKPSCDARVYSVARVKAPLPGQRASKESAKPPPETTADAEEAMPPPPFYPSRPTSPHPTHRYRSGSTHRPPSSNPSCTGRSGRHSGLTTAETMHSILLRSIPALNPAALYESGAASSANARAPLYGDDLGPPGHRPRHPMAAGARGWHSPTHSTRSHRSGSMTQSAVLRRSSAYTPLEDSAGEGFGSSTVQRRRRLAEVYSGPSRSPRQTPRRPSRPLKGAKRGGPSGHHGSAAAPSAKPRPPPPPSSKAKAKGKAKGSRRPPPAAAARRHSAKANVSRRGSRKAAAGRTPRPQSGGGGGGGGGPASSLPAGRRAPCSRDLDSSTTSTTTATTTSSSSSRGCGGGSDSSGARHVDVAVRESVSPVDLRPILEPARTHRRRQPPSAPGSDDTALPTAHERDARVRRGHTLKSGSGSDVTGSTTTDSGSSFSSSTTYLSPDSSYLSSAVHGRYEREGSREERPREVDVTRAAQSSTGSEGEADGERASSLGDAKDPGGSALMQGYITTRSVRQQLVRQHIAKGSSLSSGTHSARAHPTTTTTEEATATTKKRPSAGAGGAPRDPRALTGGAPARSSVSRSAGAVSRDRAGSLSSDHGGTTTVELYLRHSNTKKKLPEIHRRPSSAEDALMASEMTTPTHQVVVRPPAHVGSSSVSPPAAATTVATAATATTTPADASQTSVA